MKIKFMKVINKIMDIINLTIIIVTTLLILVTLGSFVYYFFICYDTYKSVISIFAFYILLKVNLRLGGYDG